MTEINPLAVLVAASVAFVLSSTWYALFAKQLDKEESAGAESSKGPLSGRWAPSCSEA